MKKKVIFLSKVIQKMLGNLLVLLVNPITGCLRTILNHNLQLKKLVIELRDSSIEFEVIALVLLIVYFVTRILSKDKYLVGKKADKYNKPNN